ncbi:MAG TPA: hypothetical protein VJY33_19440 [Isosphaeraceae bacterium]|nr:hypothetical protein [Isosphaeraceae bacterium]
MIRISAHLHDRGKGTVLKGAMEAVREIRGVRDRAQALVALVPRLAELGQVEQALEVARGIGDAKERARALAALAPKLAKLIRAQVLPLWEETLRFSSTHSRADLLADLDALAPIIAALGGAEAICESCLAIQDVGRWWP